MGAQSRDYFVRFGALAEVGRRARIEKCPNLGNNERGCEWEAPAAFAVDERKIDHHGPVVLLLDRGDGVGDAELFGQCALLITKQRERQ